MPYDLSQCHEAGIMYGKGCDEKGHSIPSVKMVTNEHGATRVSSIVRLKINNKGKFERDARKIQKNCKDTIRFYINA